jgi:hypothetical protein
MRWGPVDASGTADGAVPSADADDAARMLGERLRWVRTQQSRSLQDVESLSGGELKASVLGA